MTKPIPRDFGWRYILWFAWSNAITILMVFQGVLAALMLQQELFSHTTFRYLILGNAILAALVAQIKRNVPVGPPPKRRRR